jgi:cytochrome P450
VSLPLEEFFMLTEVEWHIFPAFQLFWDILHPIDTAAIMGAEFAVNDTYVHHMKAYCKMIPGLSYFYFVMPGILRKPFWWFSPFGFMTRHHIRKLKAVLIPEIRERIEAARRGEGYRDQFVLIDALVDMKMDKRVIRRDAPGADAKEEAKEVELCAEELMFMTFEGVGPVTLLTVQLVYELIAHPEYLQPLRDEVARTLEAAGGKWTDEAMTNMPKLESFTRETLRLNGPAPCENTRFIFDFFIP